MSSSATKQQRPAAAEVASVVERLSGSFGERAVVSRAVREQHSHG